MVSVSSLHTSSRAWKALTTQGIETAVSPTSGPPLDDNPVSSSLDLISNILLFSPSNQEIDWPSIGDSSPITKFNPQPAKIKSPTKGRKSQETLKATPKGVKKKETEGQTTLTSEPLTMKNQGGGLNPKIPKSEQQQPQQSGEKGKIRNL